VIDITGYGTPAPERRGTSSTSCSGSCSRRRTVGCTAQCATSRGLSRCARGASGRVSRSPLWSQAVAVATARLWPGRSL